MKLFTIALVIILGLSAACTSVVSDSAAATPPAAVTALTHVISLVHSSPVPGVRAFEWTLTDGDGGTSVAASQITLNAPPPIYIDLDSTGAGFDHVGAFTENGAPVAIGSGIASSPRRALACLPASIRCLSRCSSASLIVPFNPSR